MAFLDLAKAFDTILHDLFAKGLVRLGVPTQFIKVVENLYDGATTTFATANGETRQIKINQGVKQGDPLSPVLFNVSRSHVLQPRKRRQRMGELRYKHHGSRIHR